MAKIHIRIYRIHDNDLFTVIEHYKFNFSGALYCALSAYCKKDIFIINLPEKREKPVQFKKHYLTRYLSLDEEKDIDILQMLSKIPPRMRNCFLKNILRLYLCVPYDAPGYYEIFRRSRRTANAARYKRTYRSSEKCPVKKEKEDNEERAVLNYDVNAVEENKKAEPVPLFKEQTSQEMLENKYPEPVESDEDQNITELFSAFLEH